MCRLGELAMLNCPLVFKDVQFRWIGYAKLPLKCPKMCRLGGLAMLNCPLMSKDVHVTWIGQAKLPLSVREISRVNTWGYWARALLLEQARWAQWPLSALYGFYDMILLRGGFHSNFIAMWMVGAAGAQFSAKPLSCPNPSLFWFPDTRSVLCPSSDVQASGSGKSLRADDSHWWFAAYWWGIVKWGIWHCRYETAPGMFTSVRNFQLQLWLVTGSWSLLCYSLISPCEEAKSDKHRKHWNLQRHLENIVAYFPNQLVCQGTRVAWYLWKWQTLPSLRTADSYRVWHVSILTAWGTMHQKLSLNCTGEINLSPVKYPDLIPAP